VPFLRVVLSARAWLPVPAGLGLGPSPGSPLPVLSAVAAAAATGSHALCGPLRKRGVSDSEQQKVNQITLRDQPASV